MTAVLMLIYLHIYWPFALHIIWMWSVPFSIPCLEANRLLQIYVASVDHRKKAMVRWASSFQL